METHARDKTFRMSRSDRTQGIILLCRSGNHTNDILSVLGRPGILYKNRAVLAFYHFWQLSFNYLRELLWTKHL